MKLAIIECDDWEAMYLNFNDCIYQGHGMNRYDFVELLEKYNITSKEIYSYWAVEEDEQDAYDCGQFPDKFSELKGDYEV